VNRRLLGLMLLFGGALLTRVTSAGRLFVIDWFVVCGLTWALARWGRPYIPRVMPWVAKGLTVLVVVDALTHGRADFRPYIVNPNLIGSVMLLLGPWAWQWAVTTLITTQSRGAMLAGWAALGVWRTWWRKPAPIILTTVLIVVGLLFVRPDTVTRRLEIWSEAAALFTLRPWDGWGIGSFGALSLAEPGAPHAHSALLTLAAEGGLVTVAMFGVMVFEMARQARKAPTGVWWALLAFGLHQLVDFQLFSPIVALPLAATLALLEEPCPAKPLPTV